MPFVILVYIIKSPKVFGFEKVKKTYEMVHNSPKWPLFVAYIFKISLGEHVPRPPPPPQKKKKKKLPPSALTIVLFNLFPSWSIIFSLFKWSVPALLNRPFTRRLCVFFSELWIYLHLYIVKEGFSFFLMNTFHSRLIR